MNLVQGKQEMSSFSNHEKISFDEKRGNNANFQTGLLNCFFDA